MPTLQKTAVNFRAKLTPELSTFCKKHNMSPRTMLSVNPKTEKSLFFAFLLQTNLKKNKTKKNKKKKNTSPLLRLGKLELRFFSFLPSFFLSFFLLQPPAVLCRVTFILNPQKL